MQQLKTQLLQRKFFLLITLVQQAALMFAAAYPESISNMAEGITRPLITPLLLPTPSLPRESRPPFHWSP